MTLARLSSELALPKSSVHGLCTTLKHQVNEDLLAFFKA